MRNYSVMLQGNGCRVKIGEWESHPDLSTVEPVGFFTTRFVRALSPQEAAGHAREMVDAELRPLLLNQSSEPVDITVVEVREDPDGFEQYAPGWGFTWYTESIEEDDQSVN